MIAFPSRVTLLSSKWGAMDSRSSLDSYLASGMLLASVIKMGTNSKLFGHMHLECIYVIATGHFLDDLSQILQILERRGRT